MRQDASDLNALNKRAVLAAIAKNPGSSAADAGRRTGLSPTTLHRIVPQLLAANLIVEGETIRGQRGQPGTALSINADGAFSIGCQVGFGSGYLLLRSLGGQVIATSEFEVRDGDLAHVVDTISAAHQTLTDGFSETIRTRFVGTGVAVPTDFCRLISASPTTAERAEVWNERHLRSALNGRLFGPVETFSTGNAGAWAELAATPPPRPADYVYLYVDRFLQSGLLLNGKLWSGPHGGAGALGRNSLPLPEGLSRLYDLVGGDGLAATLTGESAAEAEDLTTIWLERSAEALASAIQTLTDTMQLPLIVLDGSLPTELLDALAERLAERLSALAWSEPSRVARGLAGHRAPAKGGALLPLYHSLFSDELSAPTD
jgi:predicted NBD/HSP70 family sugar kinase